MSKRKGNKIELLIEVILILIYFLDLILWVLFFYLIRWKKNLRIEILRGFIYVKKKKIGRREN